MNTRINYLYRDGSNYKAGNSFVVHGEITETQKQQIIHACDAGEYFIPHQVGMPENRFEDINEDDHPWFELIGFELTDAEADTVMTVDELVEKFMTAEWDEADWPPSP